MPERKQEHGPTKKKGEVSIREAADEDLEMTREGSRARNEEKPEVEKEAPASDEEYGQGVTQDE